MMLNTVDTELHPSPSGQVSTLGKSPTEWREEGVTILNLGIVLRSNDPYLAKDLRVLFPDRDGIDVMGPSGHQDYLVSAACNQAGRRFYRVVQDQRVVFRTRDRDALLVYLERSVSNAVARHLGKSYHLIHAAALAHNGCGILLPGPSGAGKSLIAAALALSGFEYFSDEVAMVTDDRRLLPFPKLISLKADGWRKIRDAFPDVLPVGCGTPSSEEGLWHLSPPRWPNGHRRLSGAPVRFIILPSYRSGAATALEPLPRPAALARLVEQSLNMRHLGAPAMDLLVRLVQGAKCFTLTMNHLQEVGPVVAQLAQHGETALVGNTRVSRSEKS